MAQKAPEQYSCLCPSCLASFLNKVALKGTAPRGLVSCLCSSPCLSLKSEQNVGGWVGGRSIPTE